MGSVPRVSRWVRRFHLAVGGRVPSDALSNRACGSPAHDSPTPFTVRHASTSSAPFHSAGRSRDWRATDR